MSSEESASDIERIDTNGLLATFFYRVDGRDGHFYSTMREVPARVNIELIGVATRYRGDKFRSAESKEKFRENVSRLAVDSYWFEEPLVTVGHIAEFLYRATWSDDRYLHASTRRECEFTSHEIVGVVVRPPRETVDSTKLGRDDFEENVAEVAEDVVWFHEDHDRNTRQNGTGVDRDE
jgi:hypothetical protein